jgi:hypothetical protein
MQSDGRIEKRASVEIPVRLMPAENSLIAEAVMTVDISRRGARLVSGRRWTPRQKVIFVSTSGDVRRQASVVYCQLQSDGHFCVGLNFDASATSDRGG